MILNNRISCVVGISIFGFKKYWQTVFNLMELNMSPTSKQFLQSKTVNDISMLKLPSSPYKKATGIVDSRATDIYFSTDAPVVNIYLAAPMVRVGTTTGQTQQSTVTGELALPNLPSPGLHHNLIGVGPLCDADCTVTFTREAVIVRDKQVTPVLTGWREATG